MANKSNEHLGTPGRRKRIGGREIRFDQESFGVFAEFIARFMGSPAFLAWMTIFLILWVMWNTMMPEALRFDEMPYIFLTLILSIEAAYSAPLILLAQNRQEARDRRSSEEDRLQAAQTKADMDFLAREIASLRVNVGELATRDFLRSEIKHEFKTELRSELKEMLEEIWQEIEQERREAINPSEKRMDEVENP